MHNIDTDPRTSRVCDCLFKCIACSRKDKPLLAKQVEKFGELYAAVQEKSKKDPAWEQNFKQVACQFAACIFGICICKLFLEYILLQVDEKWQALTMQPDGIMPRLAQAVLKGDGNLDKIKLLTEAEVIMMICFSRSARMHAAPSQCMREAHITATLMHGLLARSKFPT